MSNGAWGGGVYGAGAWGGALTGALELVSALATSENVVQLTFTRPVYYSGILDLHDASNRKLYTLTPDTSTVGNDGTVARPVLVASVAEVRAAGFFDGMLLALTLDRPMTPFPATYSVRCNGLVSADKLTPIDTSKNSVSFHAAHKVIVPASVDTPNNAGTRDFANPQTQSGALSAQLIDPTALKNLGTYPVDATGDYSYDEGMAGYKKRILRIVMSTPGAFLHLGNGFGVGIASYSKKLSSAANRSRMATSTQVQIARDPMTDRVSVTTKEVRPGLFRLIILAKTKTGQTLRYTAPLGTQVGA